MSRRTWTTGEASLDFPDPFWGFLQVITDRWQEQVHVSPWQVVFPGAKPMARTLVRWRDETVGDVTAAVALCPGQESEIDWGMVAESERDWSPRAVPPWIMLGFEGEGFCDPSGAYLSAEPAILPVDYNPGSRELLEAMVAGLGSPHRSTGLLIVAVSGTKSARKADHVGTVHWPGVLSVALVSDAPRLPSPPRYASPSAGASRRLDFLR